MFWPAPWWDGTVLWFTKAVAEHCSGRSKQYQNSKKKKYLQYTNSFWKFRPLFIPLSFLGREGGCLVQDYTLRCHTLANREKFAQQPPVPWCLLQYNLTPIYRAHWSSFLPRDVVKMTEYNFERIIFNIAQSDWASANSWQGSAINTFNLFTHYLRSHCKNI